MVAWHVLGLERKRNNYSYINTEEVHAIKERPHDLASNAETQSKELCILCVCVYKAQLVPSTMPCDITTRFSSR